MESSAGGPRAWPDKARDNCCHDEALLAWSSKGFQENKDRIRPSFPSCVCVRAGPRRCFVQTDDNDR